MNVSSKALLAALFTMVAAFASSAYAAESNVRPSEALPPARSTHDPLPPTPSLTNQSATLVKQAGIGSPVAYGRNGVLELGGNLNLQHSTNQTLVSLTPTIGWFFTDNFELSGLVQMSFSRLKDEVVEKRGLIVTALVEPSVHMPIVENLFIFGGWGFGGTYNDDTHRGGFAMAPRLGLNVLVGRSGILSPSVSWNFATNEVVQVSGGRNAVALNNTWNANVGYTVMW